MVNELTLHKEPGSYETFNQVTSDSECLNNSDNSECLNLNESESLNDFKLQSSEILATLQADKDLLSVCIPCVQSKQMRMIQHTLMRATN